jgi:hypothetical protein
MLVQPGKLSFAAMSGSGPQVLPTPVTFPANVTQATAILTGFTAEFANRDDHHLGQMDIQVSVPPGGISGATVTVNVTYGLRDWSGEWDDQYAGTIFFAVIAE